MILARAKSATFLQVFLLIRAGEKLRGNRAGSGATRMPKVGATENNVRAVQLPG